MIDIHCHVLPEVDDGAKTWEIAIQMCRAAWQDGIRHIVATPHANEQYFYDRNHLEETLRQLSDTTGGRPALSLGCDFHFSFENFQDLLLHPSRYTIDNTPYLLVEFSDYSIPSSIDENLAKIINIGLIPIITHPERNPLLQKTPERVLDWVRGGCVVQVTANSLTGRWGARAREAGEWLFRNGAVHVLATDAHNLDSRPPVLSKARDAAVKLVGETTANALVEANPLTILSGEPLV
jgi:protein-tyrosine phosphatase